MYYAIHGRGEPLICLHGGLAHADVWSNQVQVLSEHFTVVLPDSRGHGRSTRSAQPFSYELMASDVLALMDHLGIARASILGWSDGGVIAMEIAMNHPDRLDKVCVFGANYSSIGLRGDMSTNATFNRYIDNAGQDYRRLSPTPNEFAAFVGQIGVMWNTQPNYKGQQLRRIVAPTLVVIAEHDESIERAHAEELVRLIPGAQRTLLREVSHFAFWQQPQKFNREVLNFLLGSAGR